MTSHFNIRNYDTRLDRFRARKKMAIREWSKAAGLARTQFNKYRAGKMEPGAVICAALVRSAAKILGRPVKASGLFYLGEDEPVASAPLKRRSPGTTLVKTRDETRLDELLRRLDVSRTALARESGISRQGLRRVSSRYGMSVSTIAAIVRALRRMGYDVKASDVADVGEE